MLVNTNQGSWAALQSGARALNLGHHPPLSPRGLFSHPLQELGGPGFCVASMLICVLGHMGHQSCSPHFGAEDILLALSDTRAGFG